jgi:hypothetical protein
MHHHAQKVQSYYVTVLMAKGTSHEILANDKAVFYALCQGMGLPVPALFGVVDSSGGFAADGHPWDADSLRLALEAIDREIIVKPARGVYGQGVRAYLPTPQGLCDRTSGQVFSPEFLARALRQVGRVVIQERLQNHPDITRLSGSTALQTVRIRCLVTNDGEARMGGCVFKIAVAQNIIDNIDGGRTGNFLAAVTLTDGRLCTAVGYSKNGRGIEAVARHPDTGLALEGFCVPFWAEAKALAKQASQLFLPLRTIGWDIALTKNGPVLVEGNPCWDPFNLMAAVPVDGDRYAEEMAVLLNAMRREASGSGTR